MELSNTELFSESDLNQSVSNTSKESSNEELSSEELATLCIKDLELYIADLPKNKSWNMEVVRKGDLQLYKRVRKYLGTSELIKRISDKNLYRLSTSRQLSVAKEHEIINRHSKGNLSIGHPTWDGVLQERDSYLDNIALPLLDFDWNFVYQEGEPSGLNETYIFVHLYEYRLKHRMESPDYDSLRLLMHESYISIIKKIVLGMAKEIIHLKPHLFDDLFQEANIGFIYAFNRYNPYRKTSFKNYIINWLKNYITRYIRVDQSILYIPSNKQEKIKASIASGDSKYRLPIEISLDAPIRAGGHGESLIQIIKDESALSPYEQLKKTLLRDKINKFFIQEEARVKTKPESVQKRIYREFFVFYARHKLFRSASHFYFMCEELGLETAKYEAFMQEEMTLDSIAPYFNITRERTRQIQKMITERLLRASSFRELKQLLF